ncbi:MAG: histidine phosphatase family protein [Armatimonadota bacterium]|nr:histidine phosphatase family protein [Armatimonadota bacterium]
MAALGLRPVRTRLVLLCRGPVDWAQAGGEDPLLSASGLAAVEEAAARLPAFAQIVASAQRAARETAEVLAAIRGVPVAWRDDLDELRAAMPITDAAAYAAWIDDLFAGAAGGGESLVDGAQRLTYAFMGIGDRFHGRSTLVVSHPAVLAAFWAAQRGRQPVREDVLGMPDLGTAVVDYVEGRFYLVEDFPVRRDA